MDSIEKSCIARTEDARGHEAEQGGESRFFFLMSMCFLFSSLCVLLFSGCVSVCVLQEDLSFSALVQLFDPLLSPRCYAVVGLKSNEDGT